MRGRNLTVEDFKCDFPPKRFGTCQTLKVRGKRVPFDILDVLGLEKGYIHRSKEYQCTLPCMNYSRAKSAKECLINGGEKNPYLAFAIGYNECDGITHFKDFSLSLLFINVCF